MLGQKTKQAAVGPNGQRPSVIAIGRARVQLQAGPVKLRDLLGQPRPRGAERGFQRSQPAQKLLI